MIKCSKRYEDKPLRYEEGLFFFFLICFVVVLITEHEDFHRRLWMAVVWLVI